MTQTKSEDGLRFGPYCPPNMSVGDDARCEMRGVLRVRSWRDCGPIMWPMGLRPGRSPGHPSMIVMGDLVKAVQRESATAVAAHWGVSIHQVSRWRRALGVGRVTEGTQILLDTLGNPDIASYSQSGNSASLEPAPRARRDANHSRTLQSKPGWKEQMGKIGRRGAILQMRRKTKEEKAEFARIGGTSAGKRGTLEKEASAAIRERTMGRVFRYQSRLDKFILHAREASYSARQIADLLKMGVKDLRSHLHRLAENYPTLAELYLTDGQKNIIRAGEKIKDLVD